MVGERSPMLKKKKKAKCVYECRLCVFFSPALRQVIPVLTLHLGYSGAQTNCPYDVYTAEWLFCAGILVSTVTLPYTPRWGEKKNGGEWTGRGGEEETGQVEEVGRLRRKQGGKVVEEERGQLRGRDEYWSWEKQGREWRRYWEIK